MISFLKEVIRQHYLILLITIFSALFWPQIKQHYYGYIISSTVSTTDKADTNVIGVRLFTAVELSKYDGEENSRGFYLSIMGSVYDVQKGVKHCGVGAGYHFFTGRDASTAFIPCDFQTMTDTLDDILSLEPEDMLSLKQWKEFYEKDYTFKGKLIGRFYYKHGHETEYFRKVYEQIDIAVEIKRKEWNADTCAKVWCTKQSGGVERDWTGIPSKYFEPDKLGSGAIQEYDGCDPKSTTCFYDPDARND